MPISEDEYDPRQMAQEATMQSMSKADLRKTHKPIMEKKRRARINQSLNEIKSLILEALNKDPARHTKLEKADILEMAVKHLQNVQKQQLAIAMASDPSVMQKFKSGYDECSEEVMNYIGHIDLDSGLKQRIKNHLNKSMTNVEQMAQFNLPTAIAYPFLNGVPLFGAKNNNCDSQSITATTTTTATTHGDQNNNPRIQIPPGLQLIPSRLPTGEFAFLVPNSGANLPYFTGTLASTSNETNSKRTSAFETVVPSSSANTTRILSPPLSPSQHSNSKLNRDDSLLQEQQHRTPSPHGFRPVNPNLQKRSLFVSKSELIQKPTAVYRNDVKTIKYPINNNNNNNQERNCSPRKCVEALCIITNQAERFKQAQMLEDSVNYEENIQELQRGVKRKFNEGLLSMAPETNQRTKSVKLIDDVAPPSTSGSGSAKCDDKECQETQSKDQFESGSGSSNDMWRPW